MTTQSKLLVSLLWRSVVLLLLWFSAVQSYRQRQAGDETLALAKLNREATLRLIEEQREVPMATVHRWADSGVDGYRELRINRSKEDLTIQAFAQRTLREEIDFRRAVEEGK